MPKKRTKTKTKLLQRETVKKCNDSMCINSQNKRKRTNVDS